MRPLSTLLVEAIFQVYDDVALDLVIPRSPRQHATIDKWRGYLPYCNQFYFVTPPGLVDPGEVGSDAGLIVCSKNATRLYTKRKAPTRD